MTEHTVVVPPGMMPAKHGGYLRRGGGKLPRKEAVATIAILTKAGPAVARAFVLKALKGDVRAAEVVLQYVVGKPADKLELTGADGGPVAFYDGLDDHEKAALKAAIDAAIAARAEDDGATADNEARAAVADARS